MAEITVCFGYIMSYNGNGYGYGSHRQKSGYNDYNSSYRLNKPNSYRSNGNFNGYTQDRKPIYEKRSYSAKDTYRESPQTPRKVTSSSSTPGESQSGQVSQLGLSEFIANNTEIPTNDVKQSEIVGTDMIKGDNPNDSQFPKLLLHVDFVFKNDDDVNNTTTAQSKNIRVSYDPELDKSLSKTDKKTKSRHIKTGENLPTADPRLSFIGGLSTYLHKPNKRSKKFPFKQLPQAKFIYDKDSLGPEPLTELVIWDLPLNINEVYLTNYLKSFGNHIKGLRFINDSDTGVPLGIVVFKFQGNLEKSSRLAMKFIEEAKTQGIQIDGIKLNVALNDHDNKLLTNKTKIAQGRLRVSTYKLKEEQKKLHEEKRLQEEKKKKKQEEEQQKKRKEEENKKRAEEELEKAKTEQSFNKDSTPREEVETNIVITSIRSNSRKIQGTFVAPELNQFIKDMPYLFINDKTIPTRKISTNEIKRVLSKYSWTRVLSDRAGFYIVFNSYKECEKCFRKEDGRKFYEFRMYMSFCIPKNFKGDKKSEHSTDKSQDVIDEACNMLVKEFEMYLTKDIRERVIAPVILDLLSDDKYPQIMEELKAKQELEKKKMANPIYSNLALKTDALALLATTKKNIESQLPSFRKKKLVNDKKNVTGNNSSPKSKRTIIPMLHALNFDDSSEDSDEAFSRSSTPVGIQLKRQHSSTSTSVTTDEASDEPPPKKKIRRSFLYDSSDDESTDKDGVVVQEADMNEDTSDDKKQDNDGMDVDEEKDDYSQLEEIYQPTYDFPHPIYEDDPIVDVDKFEIDKIQGLIKDEEDLSLARELLSNVEPTKVKNVEYWAWKLKSGNAMEKSTISVTDSKLDSSSGSFRSEGYRKIPDAIKNEYLPHRKRIHKPIKTIQHEGEDIEDTQDDNVANDINNGSTSNPSVNNTSNANNHSSRVNRANNRRFVADMSAQKQMLGSETDILDLNALTKRKKPVNFARSSIHNWGLYALEPIAAKEMIIEYVGESIRQQVAEHREKSYLKTGIGSSYLFRIDENTVIDATKKGGIARFINHSCNPSCTAKIIKVQGKKRIVIYALRDIDANQELTYDYKFERETNDAERIRCLCGAPGCKGYLN